MQRKPFWKLLITGVGYMVLGNFMGTVMTVALSMFADVTFFTDLSQNTVVVPTEAILTSGGVQYVYVVEDGTARYVEISTGLTGNGVTEVTSGLSAGQQLVTVGQAYLHEGDSVRVVSGEG